METIVALEPEHGRLSRTPLSPRDPACLTGLAPVSTVAVVAAEREHASRPELLRLADGLLTDAVPAERDIDFLQGDREARSRRQSDEAEFFVRAHDPAQIRPPRGLDRLLLR